MNDTYPERLASHGRPGVIDPVKPISVALSRGENSVWLTLPATKEEMKKALLDIDAVGKGYSITDYRTSLDIPVRASMVGDDINMINYLTARLVSMPLKERDLLQAVMETPDAPATTAEMIDLTFNTTRFTLVRNVENTEELAAHHIFTSGLVNMPPSWKNGIDLYAFGTNLEELLKGVYTQKGYLHPMENPWQRTFTKESVVPDEYRIDNYLKNAELSVEQGYDLIDGIINNEKPRGADLTDGQTHEEMRELAPETLPEEKQSVIGQLRECQEASLSFLKENGTSAKTCDERER